MAQPSALTRQRRDIPIGNIAPSPAPVRKKVRHFSPLGDVDRPPSQKLRFLKKPTAAAIPTPPAEEPAAITASTSTPAEAPPSVTADMEVTMRELVALLIEVKSVVGLPTEQPLVAKSKRPYKRKQPVPVVTPVELKDRNWLTFKQAAALHPLSEQAFRRLERQASQYLKDPKSGLPSNGFESCVIRIPGTRRVFLDGNQLNLWMTSGKLVKGSRPS